MAERSAISWTRSTFNPWLGCTKVGPGCDHCYAEALDKRHRWGGDTHWGDDKPRHRTGIHYWNDPLRWNKKQELAFSEYARAMSTKNPNPSNRPEPWRVFCASLADVFDNQVPLVWRDDLWSLIRETPYLSWLLVTKRIGNVAKMIPGAWANAFPSNVRLLITVCNQQEADRDIPKLIDLPCKNGISYEPALGPVDWSPYVGSHCADEGLDWIIVGGESDQGKNKARPFNIEWARNTVRQCKATGVPVFVKQLGSNQKGWCAAKLLCSEEFKDEVPDDYCDLYEASEQNRHCDRCFFIKGRAGADPAEWPEDLRVQEFPA